MKLDRPRLPWSRDGWIAVGFAVAAAVEAVVRSRNPVYLAINVTGAPLLLLLWLRRSRPLLTVVVFCAGAIVGSVLQAWLIPHASADAFVPILGLLLAMYSVGMYGSWRQLAAAAPVPALVVVIIDTTRPHSDSLIGAIVFFVLFVVAVPLAAGRLVRGRSMLVDRLAEQGRELAEQRSAYVEASVANERLRLAGELDLELADGMHRLVASLESDHGSEDAGHVAAVEGQARELLAATRGVVTALTAAAPEADSSATSAIPPPRDARVADAAQPWICLCAGSVAAGLLLEIRTAPLHVPPVAASVATVVVALPLAFAWARPLLATAALWVAAAVFAHQVTRLDHVTTAIAFSFVPPFIVAALEPRRRALIGLAVCWSGILATFGLGAFPGDAVVATICWVAGTGLRARARLVEQLHANNVLLEDGRATIAAQALDEERTRLARELHDAVGHALTVVALQAGAARRIWNSDRVKAEQMLDATRAAALTGLRELSQSLVTSLATAPSLDELLERGRAAGVAVTADVDDDVASLPVQHLQVVYRLVQESLTNVLKHSPGSTATVSVHCTGDHVEVTVANGPAASTPGTVPRSGHGLSGMRHRLDQLGGSLVHGPGSDGGFVVHAQLPLSSGFA